MSTQRSSKSGKNKHPPIVTFNQSNKTFVCLICRDKLHDQIPKEWAVWEIPRHLEKEHGLPEEAYALRTKLIPDWNSDFEKQYRQNLEKEIVYNFQNPNMEMNKIDVDNLSKKFKKEDEKDKQLELDANRESDY